MLLQQVQFTSRKTPLVRFKVVNFSFLETGNSGADIHNVHMFLLTEDNENRQVSAGVNDASECSGGEKSIGIMTNGQDNIFSP
jgi:hypothetical protein